MTTSLVPVRPSFRARLAVARKVLVGVFDDGAMTDAYGMLARIFPGSRGEPPKRGSKEYAEAYSEMPWLRAITERIAFACASVTWRLYGRRGRSGRAIRDTEWQTAAAPDRANIRKRLKAAGELIEIEDHPFLTFLRRGNGVLTGRQCRALNTVYVDLLGESYTIKGRNTAGVPDAAWPVPPHWVLETPTPQHRYYRFGYGGWQVEVPNADVLWMMNPNPANPYSRGSGLAQAIADELNTDEYAAKYASSFFYNRARPDLIITGEGMTKEVAKELESKWTAKLRGVTNAFRPFFLNKPLDVKEVGQNLEQMKLVELRQSERDTIMQVFGIPPEIMGVLESSNRATIESAEFLMGKFVITPRLEFQREIYQERMLPEYDDRLVLEYDSPIAADRATQLQAMTAAPWAPKVDEWRDFQGLDPLEDGSGQVHMVPISLVPTPSIDVIPDAFGTGEQPPG